MMFRSLRLAKGPTTNVTRNFATKCVTQSLGQSVQKSAFIASNSLKATSFTSINTTKIPVNVCFIRKYAGSGESHPDIFKVNPDNWAQVVENAPKPILVDFSASWCGPCKQLTPRLEKLIKESGGRLQLAIVDVDESEELASQMQVSAVPTVFGYNQGNVVDSFMGLLDEAKLNEFAGKLIGPSKSL
eukprot:TRINITY_DN2033_c0_g1_i1.p1 TRINITY_DN2033_c0_g1~~TRINITY_DN2033_c0_g1_i1.p1  ORF type:complete len:187 (+),score=52.22 TRINITY_DN2033_c0_g1_i1:48-608(+)